MIHDDARASVGICSKNAPRKHALMYCEDSHFSHCTLSSYTLMQLPCTNLILFLTTGEKKPHRWYFLNLCQIVNAQAPSLLLQLQAIHMAENYVTQSPSPFCLVQMNCSERVQLPISLSCIDIIFFTCSLFFKLSFCELCGQSVSAYELESGLYIGTKQVTNVNKFLLMPSNLNMHSPFATEKNCLVVTKQQNCDYNKSFKNTHQYLAI